MKEALKLALEALEDFADVIKYDNEQDDIGSKACCGVLSYHPHSESCKAKQAITTIKAALAQPAQEPVTWRNAAIRVGEELSSVGPDGYYDMTAEQWLDWAMENVKKAQPEQEPVAWIHNFIEGGISIGKRPADLNRHPDRWTALYKDPTPCQTCQALARTVMLDQTSHDTTPPQPEERNFCPRCGKRTADLTVIHTCTPPQEKNT